MLFRSQVVADAGDVAGRLDAVGQADPGYLTKSGVGLFGGGCSDGSTYTTLLRRILLDGRTLLGVPSSQQGGGSGFLLNRLSAFADELVKGWHILAPPYSIFSNGLFRRLIRTSGSFLGRIRPNATEYLFYQTPPRVVK